jgi:hypothetical protein
VATRPQGLSHARCQARPHDITPTSRGLLARLAGLCHDFIGDDWSAVIAILAYNVGELIGRGPLAMYCCLPLRRVWPAIMTRFVMDVLICLCVRPLALSYSPYPLLALVLLLGMTTGWVATSIMQQAGGLVEKNEREAIGYLNILSIFAGFITGSAGAFPVKAVVWR